jgi:ArsR family metal-binding transcriptional regulator
MAMETTTVREAGYAFSLVNIDCLRSSTHFNVVMDLDESVEALLPYLAATLPGCTYIHGTGVINLMDRGHIVAIYPRRITATDVPSLESAAALCRKYYDTILSVAAAREAIAPILVKRLSVGVLDIFRALPGSNCGRCRALTCMAFAALVMRRESSIADCLPLFEDVSTDKLRALFARLRENGYEVPAWPESTPP